MKTTAYFNEQVLRKRPYLSLTICEKVIQNPLRSEHQPDGRTRYWARIPELGNRAVRVVVLADGETIHNAFVDRRFRG